MKSKILLGVVINSLLLCSCSLFKTVSSHNKDVDVYLLEKAFKEDSFDKAKMDSITPRFIDGEKYIPYFTLQQYASLYSPILKKEAKSEVTTKGSTVTWTISINDELYFASVISYTTGELLEAGSINNVLDASVVSRDTKALTYNTKVDGKVSQLNGASNFSMYTFDNTSFKHFRLNGEVYYPLGFFDAAYSDCSGIYYFYNYKNIYATQEVDNYAKEFKDENGNLTSSDKQMAEITNGEAIPDYLISYNANIFIFVMDNFYGLKSYYEITSMRQFFNHNGIYNDLFSTDNATRGKAYSGALSKFDDNHTVLVSANAAWGEEETPRYGGPRMVKRSALKKELLERKQSMLKEYFSNEEYDYSRGEWADTIISDSGKTAMFYFDSFKFGTSEEMFNEDGNLKEGVEQFDTYFNFLSRFKSYETTGVQNIIIDASTNGGGVIGVMGRLLALLSKDNKGFFSMLDSTTSTAFTNYMSVDANGDGEYTDDETFGNRFNFYILTSDCSFSCGNAFPLYAQLMGIKTIGENTGGGECAVAIHYMPNSEYVYHSSNMHIGYYDEGLKKFNGFESGAKPDISLVPSNAKALLEESDGDEYVNNIPSDFYDIERLESLITSK